MTTTKTNPLLQRDGVGKAKSTCYDLPPQHHTYGASNSGDFESAGDLMKTWLTHHPSKQKQTNKVNYIKYNKSLGQKASPRQDSPAREPPKFLHPKTTEELKAKRANSPVDTNVYYGRPTRASTPIRSVIGNQYAVIYELQMEQKKAEVEAEAGTKNKKKITTTKAALGHKLGAQKRAELIEGNLVENTANTGHHFKLKRFANVQPTFRLPKNNLASPRSKAAVQGAAVNATQRKSGEAVPAACEKKVEIQEGECSP